MPPAMNGFEFKQRREAINWRLLSSVDVDKIIRQVRQFLQIYLKILMFKFYDRWTLDLSKGSWRISHFVTFSLRVSAPICLLGIVADSHSIRWFGQDIL